MQSASSATETLWWVRLFDGLKLTDAAGQETVRFRSQRVGALLAYLTLHLGRACPREELYEALWPEEDFQTTANRLRVTLASLRRQLEPAGTPFGAVLDVSQPKCVRLRAEAVWCDMAEFDRFWKAGERERAAQLAQGTLLPGFYDEWILAERQRVELLLDDLEAFLPTMASGDATPVSLLPVPSSPAIQQRLPLYLTRFFGRESERDHLHTLLQDSRLVTLTGPGGIGKTRLAVESARHLSCDAVFVRLADLPDAERVPDAILRALQRVPQPNRDPLEQLFATLQSQEPLLLILDSAEHLTADIATLALQLLDAAPDLRLLVTSRQRLELPGESILALSPLEPPPTIAAPQRLAEFPAVALFLDRAQSARPDFALSPRNVDAVVQICLRLEGIPLALELAAARVTAQTPAQIAESLNLGMMELKSRQRGVTERHRSLRAAIQGSYDLLTPDLQTFFRSLSLFQGGWTSDAARAVTGEAAAELALEELVIRSLVLAREEGEEGAIRYSFLEPLRQFAVEKLSEEEQETVRRRHTHYFLPLAASVQEDDIRTFVPLDAEQENLLSALSEGEKEGSALFWKALSGALYHAFVRGRHRLMRGWMEWALAALPHIPDVILRQMVRRGGAVLLPDLGRFEECIRVVEEGVRDGIENNDPVGVALNRAFHGYVLYRQGESAPAVPLLRSALQQARALEDAFALTRCLSLTAVVLTSQGESLGSRTEAGEAMLAEAEELAHELISLLPPQSSLLSTAWLVLFHPLDCRLKPIEAYHALKEAQQLAVAHNKMPALLFAILYESAAALDLEQYEYAALRLGAGLEIQERIGFDLGTYAPRVVRLSAQLSQHLTPDRFTALLYRGRQMSGMDLALERLSVETLYASHGPFPPLSTP